VRLAGRCRRSQENPQSVGKRNVEDERQFNPPVPVESAKEPRSGELGFYGNRCQSGWYPEVSWRRELPSALAM
jgi:hypothetical protein